MKPPSKLVGELPPSVAVALDLLVAIIPCSATLILFSDKTLPSSNPTFVPTAVTKAVEPTIATLGTGAIPAVCLKTSLPIFPIAAPIPKLGAKSIAPSPLRGG
jgi:hypothetical protein